MGEREKWFLKYNTNYELTGAKSAEREVPSGQGFGGTWSQNKRNKKNVGGFFFHKVKYI